MVIWLAWGLLLVYRSRLLQGRCRQAGDGNSIALSIFDAEEGSDSSAARVCADGLDSSPLLSDA